jgi:hypothetical protein
MAVYKDKLFIGQADGKVQVYTNSWSDLGSQGEAVNAMKIYKTVCS